MIEKPHKILIIQTAFIGDTILASSVAEEVHYYFPNAEIYLLVKKGNEGIYENHPFLKIITHDKSQKLSSLWRLIKFIWSEKFDTIINLHRYFSSHLLSILSGAKFKSGFYSPLLSIFYTHTIKHQFAKELHEIDRYHQLVQPLTQSTHSFLPKLYPPDHFPKNFNPTQKYVCLFPGSIWATKQLPPEKWIELIQHFSDEYLIYLCGSKQDEKLCEYIKIKANKKNVINIAGQYSLLETASIVQKAERIYVNDSAPLHIASALNVPVTVFYCSTVKEFGFYPLSKDAQIVEVKGLECRPCGIHGHKHCPKGHFKCGRDIDINEVRIG